MPRPLLLIFHQPPGPDAAPFSNLVSVARDTLVEHHVRMFARAGVRRMLLISGRDAERSAPFGQRLAEIVAHERPRGGAIVMNGGAVPLLRPRDVRHLVATAGSPGRLAATNNRYSSDICALSRARTLLDVGSLATDNGLPRWLADVAGYRVRELPARQRLGIDLDTPLDLALLGTIRHGPRLLRRLGRALVIPRRAALRRLAADPGAELLVAGRTSSATLHWLERHVSCRVRALVEERGLKTTAAGGRPPRSVLGRLLDLRGPAALGDIVAELADGAIIDTRVLLADRLGADEARWPTAEERFRSDLLLADGITDPWLATLTRSAASARVPIQLGSHTLVGPGIRVLLGS